ncbi:hypothetical protein AURDEDRAFT_118042 [Auricularia subglabra TFB-10046 SS5]|uniref:Uncharacterized protein n=1 Tax=Auricularia subglabra (strain TFB-10046 / SS5) TaxID=717982 RepID=J0L832_AURST|nr:hypothetical protein AURDEDRAFT_118042 [Auricularia subglabra TFB-10046 SS5]
MAMQFRSSAWNAARCGPSTALTSVAPAPTYCTLRPVPAPAPVRAASVSSSSRQRSAANISSARANPYLRYCLAPCPTPWPARYPQAWLQLWRCARRSLMNPSRLGRCALASCLRQHVQPRVLRFPSPPQPFSAQLTPVGIPGSLLLFTDLLELDVSRSRIRPSSTSRMIGVDAPYR